MENAKTKRTINQCCLNGRRALGKTKSEDQDNRLKSEIFIRKMENSKDFSVSFLSLLDPIHFRLGQIQRCCHPFGRCLDYWPFDLIVEIKTTRRHCSATSRIRTGYMYGHIVSILSECIALHLWHWMGEPENRQSNSTSWETRFDDWYPQCDRIDSFIERTKMSFVCR